MDELLFVHVEEGIKRVKQTLEFQELVALLIWERARCQFVHIKGIEEWKEQLMEGKDKIFDDTYPGAELISTILSEEAFLTQGIHQWIHHQLLSPEGPYHVLNNDAKVLRDKQKPSELKQIEDEFNKINYRRKVLQTENSKHKQAIDQMKSTLIMLEEKLSKRSRLTDVKRSPARGTRKIDTLQTRVSSLRRQVATTKNILENREMELSMLFKNNREKLKETLVKLRKLDRQRLEVIFAQCQEYLKRIKNNMAVRNGFPTKLDEAIKRLATANLDNFLEETWLKVENNARLKRTGQLIGSRVNFTTSKTRSAQRPEKKDKSNHRISRSGVDNTSANGDDIPQDIPYGDLFGSSSEELLQESDQANKHQSVCSESSSGSRLETIDISDDRAFTPRLPPPFPTREFCVSHDEDERSSIDEIHESESLLTGNMAEAISDMANVHLTPREDDKERNDDQDDDEVRRMRNIKVVAKHDYKATKKTELSVKKGQIIKQKMGEDENGFSYGWTRGSKFSPKQYGWYPSGLVGKAPAT